MILMKDKDFHIIIKRPVKQPEPGLLKFVSVLEWMRMMVCFQFHRFAKKLEVLEHFLFEF